MMTVIKESDKHKRHCPKFYQKNLRGLKVHAKPVAPTQVNFQFKCMTAYSTGLQLFR